VPAEPSLDIEVILRTLAGHGVDFIVVGGVCAALHGGPVTTFVLEVVHSRAQPAKRIKPAGSNLACAGSSRKSSAPEAP